jgi:hypothetical protein
MFGLSKRERAEREIKDIQQWVLAQSVAHAARFPPEGFFESPLQMTVALEFCAFYLHAINRLSYRQGDETLREQISDPTVQQMIRTFSDMLYASRKSEELSSIEQQTLKFFNGRELDYSLAKRLVGEKFNDLESVTWLAAHNIARAGQIPERNMKIMMLHTNLVESLIDMDIANRIKLIEGCRGN